MPENLAKVPIETLTRPNSWHFRASKGVRHNPHESWNVEYLLGNFITLANREDALLLDRVSKHIYQQHR
jgi:hypothetical protein